MAIVGDGTNQLALVDVRDVVAAIALIRFLPGGGPKILIAGPNECVTQREYVDAIAEGFGVPRVKKTVPYGIAYMAGWVGEYFIHKWPASCGHAKIRHRPDRSAAEDRLHLYAKAPRLAAAGSFRGGNSRSI